MQGHPAGLVVRIAGWGKSLNGRDRQAGFVAGHPEHGLTPFRRHRLPFPPQDGRRGDPARTTAALAGWLAA